MTAVDSLLEMPRPRTPAELARIKDPVARAAAAHVAIEEHRQAQATLADIRADAIAEALGPDAPRGRKVALARELGVSPAALTKLLKRAGALTSPSSSAVIGR